MLKIRGLKCSIEYDADMIKKAAAKRLSLPEEEITDITVLKKAVDSSDGKARGFIFDVTLELKDPESFRIRRKDNDISNYFPPVYNGKKCRMESRPVIVGFGPAGIFAALILAEAGARPIVLERGKKVDERSRDIDDFCRGGSLDGESNVQFGEGGAGAFSDGKLKPGAIDPPKFKILSEFVKAGAPEEILFDAKPHIGTDLLPKVLKNLREKIISLGGEIIFRAKMTDIKLKENTVAAVEYVKGENKYEIPCDELIIATGHSARDTFALLKDLGLEMKQKGFGIGVRIEHPREYINRLQYGEDFDNPRLPTADYHLVSHLSSGRTAYSFCMCPGGTVVAATSADGAVVTNGMSRFARDGENSNSAILVSITPEDFESNDPLAGTELQKKIEKAAFAAGGSDLSAPVQLLGDFMEDRESVSLGEVRPSYPRGVRLAPLASYLPRFITESLKEGFRDMDDWKRGFMLHDAVLTGAETRTTSPVFFPRSERLTAVGFEGIYPCGEGSGNGGGIVSSALDGIKCAESIIEKHGDR